MKRIAILLALLLCLSACGAKDQEITVTPEADNAQSEQTGAAAENTQAPEADAAQTETAETDAAQTETAETDAAETDGAQAAAAIPVVEITEDKASYSADDGTEVLVTNRPVFTVTIEGNEAAAAAIQESLTKAAQENMDLLAHGASGESESLEAEAREGYAASKTDGWEWSAPYSNELTATVSRCDDQVVSVIFGSYTYAGGVHGFHYAFGRSYDAKTGERLTLENLSAEGANLQEYALAAILEQTKDTQRFEADMFFEGYEDSLPDIVNDDFYFDDNGMVFSAAPYALAAYAYGEIDFTLPYADLSGVVQEQYLK